MLVLPQVSVERTFLGHRPTDANDPNRTEMPVAGFVAVQRMGVYRTL
jgi:hypothetical protein